MEMVMTAALLEHVWIDRGSWLRGEGSNDSGLLVYGRRCCLGFVCQQLCGMSDESLSQLKSPLTDWRLEPSWRAKHKTFTSDMMTVNDDERLDDAERERELYLLGVQIGLHLIFVD
jgi:hypothetical protein